MAVFRFPKKKRIRKSIFKGQAPEGIDSTLGIKEELRDKLNKRDWSGPLKRTLQERDPNTMTTKELEQIEFSGIRYNEFTNEAEIWVLGKVRASANATAVAKDPSILAEMHERVFKTVGSLVDISEDGETTSKVKH